MQKFNYGLSQLGDPSEEVRLLELFASGTWTAPLQCNLVITVLRERSIPFKALSYAWISDQASTSHVIQVVARSPPSAEANQPGAPMDTVGFIPITASLDDALRHLRSPTETTRLWIDQICINQADDAERAQQVSLMGQLYEAAAQVLVWLGPAADDSDAVMDAWRDVGQEARDWGMESYYTQQRLPVLQRKVDDADPDDEDTRKLQDILERAAHRYAPLLRAGTMRAWFDRPWFTRVWVVQEFCLCPDTVFVCGRATLAVELVMVAVQVLHFAGSRVRSPTGRFRVLEPPSVHPERLSETADEPTARLFSCRKRREKFARREPGATGDGLHLLLRKLFVGHDMRATLHRDHIYGLLGLAVDAEELGIRPDYAEKTTRILTHAARAMIEIGGRVDVLCYSQFPKVETCYSKSQQVECLADLPSWVPDWRANLRPSFYTIHEAVDAHYYAACGDSAVEAVAPPNGNENILSLQGYLVDTVERVADDAWTDMRWDHVRYLRYFTQFDELYELSLKKEDPILGEGATRCRKEEARWRVPIGDVYRTPGWDSRRASAEVAVEHGRCLENVHEFHAVSLLKGPELDKRSSAWLARHAAGLIGDNYRTSMTTMAGMRPYLTAMGYLGMGPAQTAPGDAVVIFCGGRIPFVIRPKTGVASMWCFVGEAYCDGVMDGQVIDHRAKEVFNLA